MSKNLRFSSHAEPDKKLIFVGGKGGVGKSSVASALAWRLSRTYKTLLISTDPAHSTGDSLGTDPHKTASRIEHQDHQLDTWELDSAKAFDDFKDRHSDELQLLFDTSTYMDQEDIDQILSLMIPGIDEVMGLKAVVDILKEGTYQKIVVDTAPTGHALRLLFMPEILNHWVKVMANMRWKYKTVQKTFKGKYTPDDADDMLLELKRTVSRMQKILVDAKASEFVLVAQPARMVISETQRLFDKLKEHKVAVNTLVVNCIAPDSKDDFYHQIFMRQKLLLTEIKALFPEIDIISMPLFPQEIVGIDKVEMFENQLFDYS